MQILNILNKCVKIIDINALYCVIYKKKKICLKVVVILSRLSKMYVFFLAACKIDLSDKIY